MSRRVLKRKMPSIPPELDVVSECMDPKKVLDAKGPIWLPCPKAKTYNNLAEYYSHTFLQKNDRKKNDKEIILLKERNYAWYYSTIGYDPSYGNEYYTKMNKQFNQRKRRKNKKPVDVSIIPCEPMRSKKVVNIKSDYKLYCRRKFPKWFKEFFSSYEANLDQDTTPRMSLDEFVVRIMETTHVEGTSTSLAQNYNVRIQKSTNPDRNVLLKFNKNTDPLSFLKCIIFGKVDIDQPLTINVKENDKHSCDLPLPLFAQSPGFVPEANIFLCIDIDAVDKNDNSAYETESSGYMSDGSVDLSTRRLQALHTSRHSNLNSIQTILKSKNASRLSKHTEMSVSKVVLKATENSLALETMTEKDTPPSDVKDSKNQSIIVSINRKWVTLGNLKVKSAENSQRKENQLLVGCRCNSKISKELSYQCTCGFYKNAVDEIRKFKIPRKQAINS